MPLPFPLQGWSQEAGRLPQQSGPRRRGDVGVGPARGHGAARELRIRRGKHPLRGGICIIGPARYLDFFF